MKHLYIKQNNNVEIVSSDIIEKLYQISQGGLYSTSDLIGNLQCTHAYEDAVTYLTTKFKNLQINVTDGKYIRFADSAVASICATNWGDGIGVTELQATSVSSVGTKFQGNSKITSLIDLKLFTNLTKIDTDGAFCGCTSLVNIEGLDNITSFASNVFRDLSTLKSINITNKCDTLGWAMCDGDSKLETIGDISNVKEIPDYCFYYCKSLTSVNISSVCTNIGTESFYSCQSLKYIKCLAITPPTIGTSAFYNSTCKIYVPDASVSAYKAATNWSVYASRIFSLTQFAIDFPNG